MTPILEAIPALYHIAEAGKFPVCTQHVEREILLMFISYHHTTPTQHRTAYDAPPRWLLAPGIPISPQRCTPAHLMTWAHYSPAAAPRNCLETY